MADSELQRSLQPLLDWLARHVNGHRFLWLLALACFLIAWNRGIELLYGLLALLLAVLAVSWLSPWLAVRTVNVSRRIHGPVQAGKPFTIEYRISAPRPRYHLVLTESLPVSGGQTLSRHFLPSIEKDATFTAPATCPRRGVFDLESVTVGCAWPFGFVYRQRAVATPPCRLVVMPATFPIETFPVLRSDIHAIDGYHRSSRPDMQTEFAGVREYREGDNIKHIHWPASARHEELIVREYDSHDRPHLLVVLDARRSADIGEGHESTLEYAVSIAASLIEYAIEHQWGLHLYASGRQPFELSVAPGNHDRRTYLEPLAWFKADGETPYPQAVQEAVRRFGDVNALVTFRNQSEAFILPSVRTGHCEIVLQDRSFIYPASRSSDGWQTREEGRAVLNVRCDSDLSTLFRV